MEQLSPELSSDVKENGVYITGGGGLISGMDKLVSEELNLEAEIPDKPMECVVLGTGKALESIELLEDGNSIINKR